MFDAWEFWLFIAISVFWAVGAYRRLVDLRSQVTRQFAVLEDMMLRYQGLVQDADRKSTRLTPVTSLFRMPSSA